MGWNWCYTQAACKFCWCWHCPEKSEGKTASRGPIYFQLLQKTPLQSNTAASFSRIAVLVYCGTFQAQLSRYCSKRTIQCFKQTIASLCSVPPNCRRGAPNNNVATKMREQTNGSGCADELRNHRIVLSRRADTRVRRQKEHGICALFLPLGGWLRPLRLKWVFNACLKLKFC